MGRPVFNYELSDPDFSWLISSFKENNPNYAYVEASGVPIAFIGSKPALQIEEGINSNQAEFEVKPQSAQESKPSISENK